MSQAPRALAEFLDHSPQSKGQRLKDRGHHPSITTDLKTPHCCHTCCVNSWAMLTLACQNIQLYTHVRGQGKERSLCLENHRDHCRYPQSPSHHGNRYHRKNSDPFPSLSHTFNRNLYNFPFCSPGVPFVTITTTVSFLYKFLNFSFLHV